MEFLITGVPGFVGGS